MAKKNSTKDTEQSLSLFGKIRAIFKNETIHFVIGLVLVIFSVYLLLAFSSFFFTGAADQSIIDSGNAQELASTNNGVKNYAGSRGAQLASYLINDCFGISSFFILVFLAVAGLKLMRVRVVRLWKWFIGCSLLLVWFSVFFGFAFVEQYKDSFLYLGGMHGYNVSNWLVSQVGVPGVWMILLVTAICFLIYLSARTVIWLRRLFSLSFLKRKQKEEEEKGETPEEFTDSWRQCGRAGAHCTGERCGGGRGAWAHKRAVLCRTCGLGHYPPGEGGGINSRHWKRGYPHAGGCGGDGRADRLRRLHDRARSGGKSLDFPSDSALF